MPNYGCRICTDYSRPDRSLVEAFRGLAVANIDDNMQRIGALDAAIRPLNHSPLLGTAFTVRVPAGDNLMFHAAMDLALPGDVVIIDAGGVCERAIFGELMATYCRVRGLAGIVVDGAVRDSAALSAMTDFPIYARGITPDGPYKNGPGEIGTVISVGGQAVCPGDILVGDADGIVVIRPEDAAELAMKTKATSEKEAGIIRTMLTEGTYIRPWVEEKLKEIGCGMPPSQTALRQPGQNTFSQ